MEELTRYMRAMVLLQLHIAQLLSEQRGGPALKAEAMLADAGIPTKEIAVMLGKSPVAVAKAISRARAARRPDGNAVATDPLTGSGDPNDA